MDALNSVFPPGGKTLHVPAPRREQATRRKEWLAHPGGRWLKHKPTHHRLTHSTQFYVDEDNLYARVATAPQRSRLETPGAQAAYAKQHFSDQAAASFPRPQTGHTSHQRAIAR